MKFDAPCPWVSRINDSQVLRPLASPATCRDSSSFSVENSLSCDTRGTSAWLLNFPQALASHKSTQKLDIYLDLQHTQESVSPSHCRSVDKDLAEQGTAQVGRTGQRDRSSITQGTKAMRPCERKARVTPDSIGPWPFIVARFAAHVRCGFGAWGESLCWSPERWVLALS